MCPSSSADYKLVFLLFFFVFVVLTKWDPSHFLASGRNPLNCGSYLALPTEKHLQFKLELNIAFCPRFKKTKGQYHDEILKLETGNKVLEFQSVVTR